MARRKAPGPTSPVGGHEPRGPDLAGEQIGPVATSKKLPNQGRELFVHDGTLRAGTVVEHDGGFDAFDTAGNLIGKFSVLRAAVRSIPAVRP